MNLRFSIPLEQRITLETRSNLPQHPERWMGVPEMAILKGCSEGRIRNMIRAGLIPATREGKTWTITVSTWNAYSAMQQPKRLSTRKRRSSGLPN